MYHDEICAWETGFVGNQREMLRFVSTEWVEVPCVLELS